MARPLIPLVGLSFLSATGLLPRLPVSSDFVRKTVARQAQAMPLVSRAGSGLDAMKRGRKEARSLRQSAGGPVSVFRATRTILALRLPGVKGKCCLIRRYPLPVNDRFL